MTFIALVAALLSLLWQIISFTVTRVGDKQNRNFEAYHRLIKELVKPEDGATHIDRQIACPFELRRFTEYRGVSLRILHGLTSDWKHFSGKGADRLSREMELTKRHLEAAVPFAFTWPYLKYASSRFTRSVSTRESA